MEFKEDPHLRPTTKRGELLIRHGKLLMQLILDALMILKTQ